MKKLSLMLCLGMLLFSCNEKNPANTELKVNEVTSKENPIKEINLNTDASFLLLTEGENNEKLLAYFPTELGESCELNHETNFDLDSNLDALHFSMAIDNLINVTKISEIKLEDYTNNGYYLEHVCSLQSGAGAKLIFHDNEGGNVPIIYGEADVRDSEIEFGFGIDLSIQDAYFVYIIDEHEAQAKNLYLLHKTNSASDTICTSLTGDSTLYSIDCNLNEEESPLTTKCNNIE